MPISLNVKPFDGEEVIQVAVETTLWDFLSALRLNSVVPIVEGHEILAIVASDDEGALIFKCLNVPLLETALINSAASDINRIEAQASEIMTHYDALKDTCEDQRKQLELQAGHGADQIEERKAHAEALDALRSENEALKAEIDTLTAPKAQTGTTTTDETTQKAGKSAQGRAKAT